MDTGAVALNVTANRGRRVVNCSGLFRVVMLAALVGGTLVVPASAGAQQSAVDTVITLADGTSCRVAGTSPTVSAVDAPANYSCTDGRWIVGEPFELGDGRRVVMLVRLIAQGEGLREGEDPCQEAQCVVGLEQAEVASTATLPRAIRLANTECTFQKGETFYVGTARANYLCDPKAWTDLDVERWVIGSPIPRADGLILVFVAEVVRQGTSALVDSRRPPFMCHEATCVLGTSTYALDPRVSLIN